jgi:hypothetical protein
MDWVLSGVACASSSFESDCVGVGTIEDDFVSGTAMEVVAGATWGGAIVVVFFLDSRDSTTASAATTAAAPRATGATMEGRGGRLGGSIFVVPEGGMTTVVLAPGDEAVMGSLGTVGAVVTALNFGFTCEVAEGRVTGGGVAVVAAGFSTTGAATVTGVAGTSGTGLTTGFSATGVGVGATGVGAGGRTRAWVIGGVGRLTTGVGSGRGTAGTGAGVAATGTEPVGGFTASVGPVTVGAEGTAAGDMAGTEPVGGFAEIGAPVDGGAEGAVAGEMTGTEPVGGLAEIGMPVAAGAETGGFEIKGSSGVVGVMRLVLLAGAGATVGRDTVGGLELTGVLSMDGLKASGSS